VSWHGPKVLHLFVRDGRDLVLWGVCPTLLTIAAWNGPSTLTCPRGRGRFSARANQRWLASFGERLETLPSWCSSQIGPEGTLISLRL
jgi:hypothetical protein